MTSKVERSVRCLASCYRDCSLASQPYFSCVHAHPKGRKIRLVTCAGFLRHGGISTSLESSDNYFAHVRVAKAGEGASAQNVATEE